jgi:uncharacterized protein (TIGR03437 family)
MRQARLSYLLPITATAALAFQHNPENPPQLSARTVVNAADYRGGGVAPGEIVVLFPANAGPLRLAEWPTIFPRTADDLAYIERQPGWETIGSTRVLFDGIAAPVVYSVDGEVEAIVPDEVSNRTDTEVVVEYKGARSSAVKVPVIARAPAIFTRDSSGGGQAAMLNQTGCCNSPFDPAMPGSIATLFATGEGRPAWSVTVTVGNVPAEVLYANNLGMLVVNFRVPVNAPTGDSVPLTLTVGDFRNIEGVTMAIRPTSHRVLIIGSDPVLGPLTEILKRSGYEIVTTRDPQFDLVIADLATPLATIEAIRTTHAHIKIAIAADDATPTLLKDADILGASAVLTSSLSEETILQRVAALLR